MTARRFPPLPWTVEEQSACFVVRDHNRHVLAQVYFGEEPGCRSAAMLLTKDEARRIATKFAKLPELLHPILANPTGSLEKRAATAPAACRSCCSKAASVQRAPCHGSGLGLSGKLLSAAL